MVPQKEETTARRMVKDVPWLNLTRYTSDIWLAPFGR